MNIGGVKKFLRGTGVEDAPACPVSCRLLKLLLPDSGRLQEEDAEYANRKGFAKHRPALPLYTEQDATAALKLIQRVSYEEDVRLNKFISARFIPAGLGRRLRQHDPYPGEGRADHKSQCAKMPKQTTRPPARATASGGVHPRRDESGGSPAPEALWKKVASCL